MALFNLFTSSDSMLLLLNPESIITESVKFTRVYQSFSTKFVI